MSKGIDWGRGTRIAAATLLLAACGGGSGSTGLSVLESSLLDSVRRDGTCLPAGATTFCATGASAPAGPGGARAEGGELFGLDVGVPCPSDLDGPCSDGAVAVFEVSGLGEGAACAVAARAPARSIAGAEGPWATGPLVRLAATPVRTAFPLPAVEISPALETALLCFERPPPALPAEFALLQDAEPDVVFVPR